MIKLIPYIWYIYHIALILFINNKLLESKFEIIYNDILLIYCLYSYKNNTNFNILFALSQFSIE